MAIAKELNPSGLGEIRAGSKGTLNSGDTAGKIWRAAATAEEIFVAGEEGSMSMGDFEIRACA